MQRLFHLDRDTLSALQIMPTQVHPWIGLCTSHFNSWQRSTVHFQNVSPENRELTWCSWMYSKPPDRCLEKNRHSVNIVKHINKVSVSVHVILIFPVIQMTTSKSPLPSFSGPPLSHAALWFIPVSMSFITTHLHHCNSPNWSLYSSPSPR